MNALVYHAPGRLALESKSRPELQAATDAVVRISHSGISAMDLRILDGQRPEVAAGTTLGHEGVGFVQEVGLAVRRFKACDPVVVSSRTVCGLCGSCRAGLARQCQEGGWRLGRSIDGTQAEYVRVPHADLSLHPAPEGVDRAALVLLSELLPTGFDCVVRQAGLRPGDDLAIIGAGALGLAVLLTAQLVAPGRVIALDVDAHRLAVAMDCGASHTVNALDGQAAATVLGLTADRGADVVVEAAGTPAAFALAQELLAAGGRLVCPGSQEEPLPLRLDRLGQGDFTLCAGPADAAAMPRLLRLVAAGKLQPGHLLSHQFGLEEAARAYGLVALARENQVIKVVLRH